MPDKPKPQDPRPASRRGKGLYQTDPPLFTVDPVTEGYSVEDAYRLLAGKPFTPVETTPVE